MTAYPGKGGQVLSYAVESALGTAGTEYGIRAEEGMSFPASTRQLAAPSRLGRQHWADTDDVPVTFESIQESAVKIPAYVRGAATATDEPPLVSLLKSAGLNSVKTTSANLDSYTNGKSFSIDSSAGSVGPGDALALQVDDGNHWPFIVANAPASAAYDVIPGYAVPGSVATAANNDVYGAYCLTPRAQQVPTTSTLTFNHYMRQPQTASPTTKMKWTASGCALAEIPKMTFEPGKPIKLDMSFHVADLALSGVSYSTAPTTVKEQQEFVVWGGASSQFAFASSNTSGGINAGTYNLIKADVDFQHKIVPIIGTGTTGTLNNCQGYMSVPGHAKITLDLVCDYVFWDDVEDDTFQDMYIHFAQAGSTTRPFFGAFFPRCYQTEMPQITDRMGDYIQCRLVYTASAANWGGNITVDTDPSAPWAIVLGRAVDA